MGIPAGRSVMTELVAVSLRAAALALSAGYNQHGFMHNLRVDATMCPMRAGRTQHHAVTGAGCLLQPCLQALKARKLWRVENLEQKLSTNTFYSRSQFWYNLWPQLQLGKLQCYALSSNLLSHQNSTNVSCPRNVQTFRKSWWFLSVEWSMFQGLVSPAVLQSCLIRLLGIHVI